MGVPPADDDYHLLAEFGAQGVNTVSTRVSDDWSTDDQPPNATRLSRRALEALELLPRRLATLLLFPASEGGYIGLDTWRTREWYPALEAAGNAQRGPYHLRHTFAIEALAAGVSTLELARLMGRSLAMIDRTYRHLARDSEDSIRARLDARAERSGVEVAPASPE